MLQEAIDFRDESTALFDLLEPLTEQEFDTPTLFKQWTLNDVLSHLHFFNRLADHSLRDKPQFERIAAELQAARAENDDLVAITDTLLEGLKGRALLAEWQAYFVGMGEAWREADPKQRLTWFGPSMSVRSSISARLMETWAHGQAIYDLMGVERIDTDRVRSIAVMGVNTFGWTFMNRGLEVPGDPPHVRLTAPSGERWEWHTPSESNRIAGRAVDFCQVVTQVRNIADTGLVVAGETATRWMTFAQCFAGPPRDPPAPGTRGRSAMPFKSSAGR
jgi:uncharacterized protein (TIGR03084 family)